MNQAEVIHAGWVNRDRQNLSLLDVSHADTRDALQLVTELEQYEVGVAPRGKGPSYSARERGKHIQGIKRAKRLGQELFSTNACYNTDMGHLIDENSAHHPRNRKGIQRKQNGNQKGQSTQCHVTNQLPDTFSVDSRIGTLLDQAQLHDTSTSQNASRLMQARPQNAMSANQQPPLLTPPFT